MTNLIHALLNSHEADNNVLFSLLFFLHFQEIESVDVDRPISLLDEDLIDGLHIWYRCSGKLFRRQNKNRSKTGGGNPRTSEVIRNRISKEVIT
jgi:hypothetical protein